MEAKQVEVKIIGGSGNVFAIISTVMNALNRAGFQKEADDFVQKTMNCDSYEEVLQLCMETVTVS